MEVLVTGRRGQCRETSHPRQESTDGRAPSLFIYSSLVKDRAPLVSLRSLSVRLLVPLLVLIGGALALHAFVEYRATRQRLHSLVSAEAHHYANLIVRAAHDRMLLDTTLDVQRTMEHLAEDERVMAIRIFDHRGRIVQSAIGGEVGSKVSRESDEPCISCHRGGPPRSSTSDVLTLAGATPVLRHVMVIPNERSCASAACHEPAEQEPILGVLDIEVSMASLQAAVRSARRNTLWTMAGLVLVTSLLTTGLVRRLVHRPIRKLQAGTQRLAQGELDARIDVNGSDELSQLAESINHMAADVQAARHEVDLWSRHLEEKVVAKTDELRRAQGHVVQMERMASLGKLSATVAHELNNPLSGILMCARLVDRELDEHDLPVTPREEVRKNLEMIQRECQRCGSIVQNLLLFARQSDGAPMAPVDANEIADRSLMLIRHHLQISNIVLDVQPLEGDPELVADAGQLEQALVALLVNAVEAMTGPDGSGGRLTVRLAGDSQEVTFSVADTGAGIHPDVMPQIFEPFFSTKHQESGVGLGLAVVFGIVQRHAGSIDVVSEPGQGATFYLRLPRRPPDSDRKASPKENAT